MRLTEREFTKKDYDVHEYELQDALNKLGQLEDIEDQLGIDLITLLKALTSGIYYKRNDNNIGCLFPCEIALGDDGLSRKEWDSDVEWYFKDYGKTWALTKEELL